MTLVAETSWCQYHLSVISIASHCAIVPLKVMLTNPVQSLNAELPILVTLSGMVILVKVLQ